MGEKSTWYLRMTTTNTLVTFTSFIPFFRIRNRKRDSQSLVSVRVTSIHSSFDIIRKVDPEWSVKTNIHIENSLFYNSRKGLVPVFNINTNICKCIFIKVNVCETYVRRIDCFSILILYTFLCLLTVFNLVTLSLSMNLRISSRIVKVSVGFNVIYIKVGKNPIFWSSVLLPIRTIYVMCFRSSPLIPTMTLSSLPSFIVTGSTLWDYSLYRCHIFFYILEFLSLDSNKLLPCLLTCVEMRNLL